MSLVTPDMLKEHVETDLSAEALQRVIDGVEADITVRAGVQGADVTERISGRDKFLFLAQAAQVIGTVNEISYGTTTALSADDYQIWNGGWQLERLSTGTHGARYWGNVVEVTYTPAEDDARRTMVAINLCKLELQFNGLVQESAGGYNMTVGDYEKKRRDILSRLGRGLLVR